MAIDTASPRTRRALLAAGLGAGAATIASALGRPLPAAAANGDVVTVGSNLSGSNTTRIFNPNGLAISGRSTTSGGIAGTSGSHIGVTGSSDSHIGVSGGSDSHIGVQGLSNSSDGVSGESNGGVGVRGQSQSVQGIVGQGTIGVEGISSSVDAWGVGGHNTASGGTGVWGAADGAGSKGVAGYSAVGRGVHGEATSGQGVHGEATSGRGVHGQATTGRGVHGQATTGTGVYATATTGYGLRAVGRVKLDNCSGIATIVAGNISTTVGPGIALTTSSAIVASLMGTAGGKTTVHRCVVNMTANTFTIYLTANSTTNARVAWHVFG